MKISLQLGPETQETIQSLGYLGGNIARALDEGLGKGAEIAAGAIQMDYLTGQVLKRRTGNLARSIFGVLTAPGEATIGVPAGTAVERYKWLLGDETKKIKPLRGKYLAIPIGEALTAAGVARYTSPRQVQGGFFVKTKTGRLLFGYKKGKKGKFRPLFRLVESVTIEGSDALASGVMANLDNMTAAIQQSLDREIASGGFSD